MPKKSNIKSVSEITSIIKNTLENQIGLVSVEGEISNYKPHYTGHRYFTLKDDGAQLSCNMWKTRILNFNLQDGQRVVATGTITVYPPRGTYQLDVMNIMPAGVGDLYQAFELLKQKLHEKGFFDAEHKKPLPEMPMNIGVSTSPTGAAVKDIFSTIKRRFQSANIYFRPTIVQGESAPNDIEKAIKELAQTQVEIIIVGRGGGSIEDLWAYNTEQVAEAIFNCDVPIISAVGHETDFTIADFVADVRAATPTAAAELATPKTYIDMMELYNYYQTELTQCISSAIQNQYEYLKIFDAQKTSDQLLKLLFYQEQTLESKIELLQKSMKYQISNYKNKLEKLENSCKALSPTSPLCRGYALLMSNSKTISNNESLADFRKIEIVRKNEKALVKFEKLIDDTLF